MIQKIKTLLLIAITTLTMGAPALIPASAFACSGITGNINQGINEATSSGAACSSSAQSNVSIKNIAQKIVNVFSIIVGIVAVVMIIVGGFRYITSGGESSNVSGAKNTLIYAIVGLIIVALAQFIVHYVLNTATGAGTGSL